MIKVFQWEKLVGHISGDSTSLLGREKAIYTKKEEPKKKKRKRGVSILLACTTERIGYP